MNLRNSRGHQVMCILVCALSAILATERTAFGQGSSRPPMPSDVRLTPKLGEPLPQDLMFRTSTGKEVRLGDYLIGKPVILTPVYYRCPMLCNLELDGLVRCLRAMSLSVGKEFDVVTFSFDPSEDESLAARKKKGYVRIYGRDSANEGWHFLTGSPQSVEKLCQSIGFQTAHDPKTRQYAHAAAIMVVTPDGRLARYLYGVEFSPRELRLALVEASNGQISTVSDQVMLFCYAFDPARGKYGLAIHRLLQVFGVTTALAIAAGVSWMLWRERHPANRSLSNEHLGELQEVPE